MNNEHTFNELRYWLGLLDSATAEVELDQLTRGPDAWKKNDVTYVNQMRMQNSAAEGLRLWREAKQIAADDPSPSNVQALAKCEQLIHRYLARFEEATPMPTDAVH